MQSEVLLNVWNRSWELDELLCPCDVHFVEWIDYHNIRDAIIFHFGTGSHHIVGIENSHPDRRNAVLGITASRHEYERYEDIVTSQPHVLRYYHSIFADIYMLNEKLLAEFDIVTAFHLCEFRDERNDLYNARTDLELLTMLTNRIKPGGYMLFYLSSDGFDRPNGNARDVIKNWERDCRVEHVGIFKTLDVYRKMGLSENTSPGS
jgi:hypothetical protein